MNMAQGYHLYVVHPRIGIRRSWLGLAIIALLWVVAPCFGQTQPTQEFQQKAAVIMNFALYTYWPVDAFSSNKSPINICLYKEDPFGMYIDELISRRKYQSDSGVRRNLAVWRVNGLQDFDDCHIVFMPGKDISSEEVKIASTHNRLLIGETRQFTKNGGQMSIYMKGDNVGFSVNLDAIADVGLSISSQLLRLAEIVREK